MEAFSDPDPIADQQPSLAAANGLFLLSLILVAVGGSMIQMVSVSWGLVATEILLIFLPAYLYLRWQKMPVAETVRWRWPGARVAFLTVWIGLCLYLFAAFLSTILLELLGYSEQIYAGMVPESILDALVMGVGMAILAPLCEEFLFRGVIQRAYQARGIRFSIIGVAVMFAFFHLSFLRFLGILPFALVLCWMYWRSDSLVTSVLLHASYNLMAPFLLLAALLWPDAEMEWFVSPYLGFGGLAVAIVMMVIFRQVTVAPPPPLERAPFGWKQAWPLIPAALIILTAAGAEMYVARHPDLLGSNIPATESLVLASPDWIESVDWTYEIRNRADEVIGEAHCQRFQEEAYNLNCTFSHQKAYELRQGSSYFQDGVHEEQLSAQWDANSLVLLAWQNDLIGDDFENIAVLTVVGDSSMLQVKSAGAEEMSLDIPSESLLPSEWAWRVSALAFEDGLVYQVIRAYPLKWSQEDERSQPQTEVLTLHVVGQETITALAGEFSVWKVKLGDETAWYAVDSPHDLIQYDNGMSIYTLSGVQR